MHFPLQHHFTTASTLRLSILGVAAGAGSKFNAGSVSDRNVKSLACRFALRWCLLCHLLCLGMLGCLAGFQHFSACDSFMNTASIIFVLESWRTEVRIRERSAQRGLPNRNDRTPRLFPPRIAEERTCMPTQLPLARFQSSTSSVTHGDDRTCCGELIRHDKTIAFLEKKRSRKKKRSCILYTSKMATS